MRKYDEIYKTKPLIAVEVQGGHGNTQLWLVGSQWTICGMVLHSDVLCKNKAERR